MRTQTSLGKLVHTLIGGGPTSLDHIKNPTFVGCQTNHLTGNFTAHQRPLASGLGVLWGRDEEIELCVEQYNHNSTAKGGEEGLVRTSQILFPSLSIVEVRWTYPLSSRRLGLHFSRGGLVAAFGSLCVSVCHGNDAILLVG